MLDMKLLMDQPEMVTARLATRGTDIDLRYILDLGERRRQLIARRDQLRHTQKQVSRRFAQTDISNEERERLRDESRDLGRQVALAEQELRQVEDLLVREVLLLPNLPHPSVPIGEDESQNAQVRTWGEPARFTFEPRPHWEIGERLGILDFESARKVSGSRQVVYKGPGAMLERALANFMLDLHTREHGYEEVLPPYLVTAESMQATGQLPKFEEELYPTTDNLYIIPTAEVPVTNLHRDEILPADVLPIKYVAYSSCFRREAGSHGKDVRGITRLHQFQKVELVKFTTPESSYEELETLVQDAEKVLKRLGIPYRVMLLCTGDLGFGAAKCYDIEAWLPGQRTYREVSSCSCFEDFQARRANIRYRPGPREKPRFVHTLNGSGLAIGRTIIAILENYQQQDGTVVIPEAIRPYMGGMNEICPGRS